MRLAVAGKLLLQDPGRAVVPRYDADLLAGRELHPQGGGGKLLPKLVALPAAPALARRVEDDRRSPGNPVPPHLGRRLAADDRLPPLADRRHVARHHLRPPKPLCRLAKGDIRFRAALPHNKPKWRVGQILVFKMIGQGVVDVAALQLPPKRQELLLC